MWVIYQLETDSLSKALLSNGALAHGKVGLPRAMARETTGQGVRIMCPDATSSAKTLPRLGCLVQMAEFLSGSVVKISAPNRRRDETDEHFGPTSDSAEHWTQACDGKTSQC